MEQKTVDGFDIPLRELTAEEKNREITFERFKKYHVDAGEDFCDQHQHILGSAQVCLGYFIGKRPELSKELLNELKENGKNFSHQDILHFFSEEEDWFYTKLAEFINLTVYTKERVNQILIQVEEYYNED